MGSYGEEGKCADTLEPLITKKRSIKDMVGGKAMNSILFQDARESL